MPQTKITMFINQFGDLAQGWTESYVIDGASATLESELVKADTIAQLRINCCGAQGRMYGVKVAEIGKARHMGGIKYSGNGLTSVLTAESDFSDNALILGLRDANRTVEARKFMRGLPDDVIYGDTFKPGQVFGFTAQFNAFKAGLTAVGAGFLAADRITVRSTAVIGVDQPSDGRPQITLATELFPADQVGTKQRVNLSGITGAAAINGQHIVRVIARDTVKLIKKIPIFVYTGLGNLLWMKQVFYSASVVTAGRIGERKAGAPFPRIRGRSKVRVLS